LSLGLLVISSDNSVVSEKEEKYLAFASMPKLLYGFNEIFF
jgi:hypothetical protein